MTEYITKICDNGNIAVDDTILVKDAQATAGSRILEGFKPLFSAEAVTRLENKGYTVKIYYATNDLNDSEAYTTDLTNSMWQEYNSTVDLKTIKHVAFTFYNADGTLAEFEADERKRYAVSGLFLSYFYQLSELREEYYEYLDVEVKDVDYK